MIRSLLVVFVLIVAQHAMAAKPKTTTPAPAAKIVMVQPQADQQLTGTADVRIKVEVPKGATAPTIVYAGDGGRMTTCFSFSFQGVTT